MATIQTTPAFMNSLGRAFQRGRSFFRQLQWKLTLAYALSTVITVLVLGAIGVALLWYLYFWSNWITSLLADGLLKTGPLLTPYLAQSPPDQAGLRVWLDEAMVEDSLIIKIPSADKNDASSKIPAQFGRVISLAIVNPEGKVLTAFPFDSGHEGQDWRPHVPPEALPGYQAALQGETNPATLAARLPNKHIVVSAPVFGPNKQLLGAIFAQLAFPIEESEFLQIILQETILPVAGVVLAVGLIAGIFFGFFIARGLTRRLRALDVVAGEWSRGNFEALARDTSGDEMGQLAQQLNYMALQLQNLLQTRQELATLEERNRLARDLHDSVKQQIFATAMQVGAARALASQQPQAAEAHLIEAERLVHQAQQELTTLIRELRPAALEGKGLVAALRDYATDWSRQNQISAEVRVQGERPLPLMVEQTLFRVAQEALANISRHSAATSAEVHLVCSDQQVRLTISDNGQGFQLATTNGKGVGLRSMRERIEGLGGHLSIHSQLKQGTQIAAHLTVA